MLAYPNLFSPMKLRGLELKNRIILPAMETKMVADDGSVTRQFIDYHKAIAEGGCALNITEVCAIHETTHMEHFMALYTEEHKKNIKIFIDEIHEVGGKVAMQVWHGGSVCKKSLKNGVKPMLTNEMSHEDIKEMIACYGRATKMSVEAGCDAIEFHAAHSYLPHTFLSAAWNKREDEYGGSFINRMRFPLEVIDEIRKNMPEDMPLLMRINSKDDYVENGLDHDDIVKFINEAAKHGVDLADITRGNALTGAIKFEVPSIDIERGYNADAVAEIRGEVSIPVAVVGRINAPDIAEEIISSEKADLVAIGRAQIADHDFCNKSMLGHEELIRKCVACNQGCFDAIMNDNMPHITCMRNPLVGFEGEGIHETKNPKKIMIAGGSLAGLEAAIMLKKRGHNPVVFESSTKMGGQFILAGKSPSKIEMEEAARWTGEEAVRVGVPISLMKPVTAELIEEIKPDELIIAIGAKPKMLDVEGADLPHVSCSHQVLAGRKTPKGKVAIIGTGLVGLELVEYLTEKGADCILVARSNRVGANLGAIRKVCVNEYLRENHVELIKNAKLMKIEKGYITLEHEGEVKKIACDNVVKAIGVEPRDCTELVEKAKELNIPYHIAGDAARAGFAIGAVTEGVRLGLKID